MTSTHDPADPAAHFLRLHHGDAPLLLPNPWDAGSARALAWLGYEALATTSSGFAATLGRLDGAVSREDALAHAASIVAATALPVSADLENGFGDDPEAVARIVEDAVAIGLAGCSIEDFTGDDDQPIYERRLAAERITAAVTAAHAGATPIVLTARAENHLHGNDDLADTISRLQDFQEAGARRPVRAGTHRPRRHRLGSGVGRPAGERAVTTRRPDGRRARRTRSSPHLGRRCTRVCRARRPGRGRARSP